MEKEWATEHIRITITTKEKLRNLGRAGDSFEDVVSTLIEYWKTGQEMEAMTQKSNGIF